MDWQTASWIAASVGNAVNSIDKIYRGYVDFLKEKKGDVIDAPPDFQYADAPQSGAFIATSRHTGSVYQTVTYDELRTRLQDGDRQYIDTLSTALKNYELQWNSAYRARSMADGMDIGRYDAQLEYLAEQIADPLLKVLDFVQRMGLYLDDHYHAARQIAQQYLDEKQSVRGPG